MYQSVSSPFIQLIKRLIIKCIFISFKKIVSFCNCDTVQKKPNPFIYLMSRKKTKMLFMMQSGRYTVQIIKFPEPTKFVQILNQGSYLNHSYMMLNSDDITVEIFTFTPCQFKMMVHHRNYKTVHLYSTELRLDYAMCSLFKSKLRGNILGSSCKQHFKNGLNIFHLPPLKMFRFVYGRGV